MALVGAGLPKYAYETEYENIEDDYERYMQRVPRANILVGVIRLLRRRKGE